MSFLKVPTKTATVNIFTWLGIQKNVAVSFFEFTANLKVMENGYNGPWEFYAKSFVEGNGK